MATQSRPQILVEQLITGEGVIRDAATETWFGVYATKVQAESALNFPVTRGEIKARMLQLQTQGRLTSDDWAELLWLNASLKSLERIIALGDQPSDLPFAA